MPKIIYCTDLHGNHSAYKKVISYAKDNNINIVHFGADLFPKHGSLYLNQKEFIGSWFKKMWKECEKEHIKILCHFGNDDVYPLKPLFREYGTLLDEEEYKYSGYTFKAYGYVPDYPFGYKDACKLDYNGWKLTEPYRCKPLTIINEKWEVIPDIEKYFNDKGTIEEDLANITVDNKTIISIHSPPAYVGLDVCADNRQVGSKSIHDWIKEKQPLLVLSGHIHESYDVTGIWKERIGKTLVIQPGVGAMVAIEINDNNISSEFITFQK